MGPLGRPAACRAVGGGAHNPLWVQIVSERHVDAATSPGAFDGRSYGDAFLAGWPRAVIRTEFRPPRPVGPRIASTVEPDAAPRPPTSLLQDLPHLYPDLKANLHRLARLGAVTETLSARRSAAVRGVRADGTLKKKWAACGLLLANNWANQCLGARMLRSTELHA